MHAGSFSARAISVSRLILRRNHHRAKCVEPDHAAKVLAQIDAKDRDIHSHSSS
jgi:hypothetical protein